MAVVNNTLLSWYDVFKKPDYIIYYPTEKSYKLRFVFLDKNYYCDY